ncbi:MAG: hypothetical protein ACTSO9_12685 [Candidatus Helarchaeota archaeon]
MVKNIIGTWKSENLAYEDIIIREGFYKWGDKSGKWAIQGSEIWFLEENSQAGTKWFFEFESNEKLIFFNPEDFKYLGGGEYIYFQMTSPHSKIVFSRIL